MKSAKAFSPAGLCGLGVLLLISLLAVPTNAHDYLPGTAQTRPILLKGGDLYTVANGVLPKTDLLFDSGRITAIGPDLTPPDGAKVIDVTGRLIYPGLIAPNTSLGLTEIGAVRATNDQAEVGLDKGEIRAYVAYNPDSEIIPTVRSNGITTALVVPGGRLVMGRSSLINLDGWTVEDALVKPEIGLHLDWPRVAIDDGWWVEISAEEQKKNLAEEGARLRGIFDNARAYYLAKKADSTIPIDSRWEGFAPLFDHQTRLFIHADDYRQIEQAVAFARQYNVRMVLVGGREAWKATRLLLDNDIPVIVGPTHRLPMREDDDYDLGYKIPALLHDAGVPFCLASSEGASGVRNLPYQAGQAAAFGLPRDIALRALTLSTAEILGVADELGSLEIGKRATLVVAGGDLLDPLRAKVEMMFINGKPVDLTSKQTELYQKYRSR